jgi:sugar O-acyltransferase (sialic acid O-acetyltransferase NeuD family)
MTDILIIGAGGHGKVVLDILQAGGRYRPVGFLDANPKLAGSKIGGLPVLGAIHLLGRLKQQLKIGGVIVAIGDNRARSGYFKTITDTGLELINAIHPSATVSKTAVLGKNVIVAAGAVICTDCRVDHCVIVNTGATVDHECEISQSVHVCPGAHLAGRVRVGERAMIGLGANIIQCLQIGPDSIIGAGAVVLRDVPAGATVVGVPGRIIKSPAAIAA